MRLLFLGAGAFALPTLRWLAESGHTVPLVVTQPARAGGRGRKLTPTPVAEAAEQLGFETLEIEDVNDAECVDRLRSLDLRLGLVIDFGQKLGGALMAALPRGFVNLHASLLPRYRGAAPINWAITRGAQRTGCSVFRIVRRMDAGPVLITRSTNIKPEETAGELHDRLAAIGVDAVRTALDLYADGASPEGTPQDDAQATLAPKLKKADGLVRFDRPVREVTNHVCGMTPWPGARTRYHAPDGRWEDVAIVRARPAEVASESQVEPGTLDARLCVAASDGFVELLEVKPSSGRLMTWRDYVNGRRVQPGDRFSTPQR